MHEQRVTGGTGFPETVEVGTLGHAPTGLWLPAKVPTAAGGLLLAISVGGEDLAVGLMERAALSLAEHLPLGLLNILVVDYSVHNRFKVLSSLRTQGLYRIAYKDAEARALLEELMDAARERHHHLLNDRCPTLTDYNRAHPDYAQPFTLVLLNLDDYLKRADRYDSSREGHLRDFLTAHFAAGIYLIAYGQDLASVDWAAGLLKVTMQAAPETPDTPPAATLLLADTAPDLTGLRAIIADYGLVHACQSSDSARERAAALIARHAEAESAEADAVCVTIGKTPDGREPIDFALGRRSGCYHALIVGASGSGKTTLLNNLILGIGEQYGADQIRLYLMDYKAGVEFNAFAEHPNCEQIYLDNTDTGAAERLLEHFAQEITRRGERFRDQGVNDLDAWNKRQSADPLPRLILIIDEVQRLFSGPGAYRFNALLKDITRRGRAFGLHIILSTQTLMGAELDRELLTQINLRIAFRLTSEADAERVLGFGNHAPLKLPNYHFVYNSHAGDRDKNIQVRGAAPRSIPEVIAKINADRPDSQKIKPTIIASQGASHPGGEARDPGPAGPVPDWLAWAPVQDRQTEQEQQRRLLEQARNRLAPGHAAPVPDQGTDP